MSEFHFTPAILPAAPWAPRPRLELTEEEAQAMTKAFLLPDWRETLDEPHHPLAEMEDMAHPLRQHYSGLPTKELMAAIFSIGGPASSGKSESVFLHLQAIHLELESRARKLNQSTND